MIHGERAISIKEVVLILTITFLVASALPTPAQEREPNLGPYSVHVRYNHMLAMRDGVRLATDVYRPETEGHHPVIMVRNPYGPESWFPKRKGPFWASHGYVYLAQDVRGRYDSGGEWRPYFNDMNDGYDTIDWASRQSWSNGKVGTLGGSYLGFVQWLAAKSGHPNLKVITPLVTPANLHELVFNGGAVWYSDNASWASNMAGRTAQYLPLRWDEQKWYLPLMSLDDHLGQEISYWEDWLNEATNRSYWEPVNVSSHFEDVTLPVLHVGGWYDIFLKGTLDSFVGMVADAPPEARRSQKLVIGPWYHLINDSAKVGELDFGPQSLIDLDQLQLRWLDYWLKGIENGIMDEPPVQIFVMGANRWRFEHEWPLLRTKYVPYYLHRSDQGDGELSVTPPSNAQPLDEFIYDPRKPVPSIGGNFTFPLDIAGPFDQKPLYDRDDVLVYTTAPLQESVEATGPVKVTLYASSSAKDTDFTAKLIDVYPDGIAFNLTDGIVRARFRDSPFDPAPLEPGRVYEFTIDLWATSNVFRAGHRIQVMISSSNFPRFDRNLNTGKTIWTDPEIQVAKQTIYHDAERPSHILLPIIPKESRP